MQNPSANVALITGAARRIGAEIARELHHAGMNIIVHYLTSETAAKELCAELNEKRAASAIAIRADLLSVAEVTHLIDQSVKIWGRLDSLINNASQFYSTPIGDINENQWDELLNANLKAPFFLAQAALPYLKETRGSIVNIADVSGEKPLRDYLVYSVSKAGMIMLTKALAKELAPYVRVNSISPAGGICWPEGDNVLSEDRKEKIIQSTAMKREGSSSDIAKAVLFFVKEASYMTGETLRVDGGR